MKAYKNVIGWRVKMQRIESYEEISKLVFKNLKKDVITNTFLSKEDFENEIKYGNIYYISFNNGLFLLRDRIDYCILNYYIQEVDLAEINAWLEKEIDKPLIVEVVGKKADEIKYNKALKIFENLGFERQIERERFVKKLVINNDSSVEKDVDNVKKIDVKIEFCEKLDLDEVNEILASNFDKYYGCIPNKDKIESDISNQMIYKATIEGKIVGILHFRKTDKISEIRHLAVDKDFRGLGIASKMLKKYEAEIDANKVVWTGTNNSSARKIYENEGYVKDGMVSTVLKWIYKKLKI